ncbi:hypothetical protein COLO4_33935 [Corchorus olitorius]|uniref:Sulfotransferase n=1 Tax=Corchorus olitorius TaxID=93759 RepID=A0A1R3GQ57_9ROSI|nr:hypothetical protein COLO4_33935 [Corchorus olitorius]
MEKENTSPPTILNHGDLDFEISPEARERIKNTVLNLPKDESWVTPFHLYQGVPEESATWLKALTLAIVTRTHRRNTGSSALLPKEPREYDSVPDPVPFLADFATKSDIREPGLPLTSTHVPYTLLPKSALDSDSNCKIVYICMEPKNAFVSLYHSTAKLRDKELSLDKAFDQFCQGKSFYGPYWDHVLGFWRANQDRPDKVLFLQYEEMMEDTPFYVQKLAEFLGYPFSPGEENQEKMEYVNRVSENIKGGWFATNPGLPYDKTLYDRLKKQLWKYWLNPEMGELLDKITDEKLSGYGFKGFKNLKSLAIEDSISVETVIGLRLHLP